MSLKAPSVHGSERHLSHIEFFDEPNTIIEMAKALSWDPIYQAQNCDQISLTLGCSNIVVNDIIDSIIQSGAEILQDKYLEAKSYQHAAQRTVQLSDIIKEPHFLVYDDNNNKIENDGIVEDLEPPVQVTEHWKRSAMSVTYKKKEILETENYSEMDQQAGANTNRSSKFFGGSKYKFRPNNKTQSNINMEDTQQSFSQFNTPSNARGKQSISNNRESLMFQQQQGLKSKGTKKITIKQDFELIDKTPAKEFDMQEEQFRTAKEREMLMKAEQEQQQLMRDRELKEQQQRLKNLPNDVKKSSFTYDFDGKILPLSGFKTEKLGPVLTNIGHSAIQKPISIERTSKANGFYNEENENNKQGTNPFDQISNNNQTGYKQKNINRLSQYSQQNNQTQLQPALNVSVIEHFNMKQGVTLIHQNTIKTGPQQQDVDINNPDLLLNPTGKLQLSRDDYLNLTRGGNLSKSQESFQVKKKTYFNNKIDEDDDIQEDFSNQNFLKDLNLRNIQKKPIQSRKSMEGKIKPNTKDETLLKRFKMELQEDQSLGGDSILNFNNSMSIPSQINQSTGKGNINNYKFNDSIDTSIMDSFNQKLVTMGPSTTTERKQVQLPRISQNKPTQQEINSTLGNVIKFPRSRLNIKAQKALSFSHLPPPKMGQVIGHGFNSGFNPGNLLHNSIKNNNNNSNLDTILESMGNNSPIQPKNQKLIK